MNGAFRFPWEASLPTQGLVRFATLARWLGPWADGQRLPRKRGQGGGRVLLVPGLHHLGVGDPRFVRFGRILEAAGATVTMADIAALRQLTLVPSMLDQAEAVLMDASRAGPVAIMSISFGSILALHLAARHPERVRRVVLFGGYHNLERTLVYALGGEPDNGVRDPLNAPAVFIQLVDALLEGEARVSFIAAAQRFCAETWTNGRGGPQDDKLDGRHLLVGSRIADSLAEPARGLMRLACRLEGDPLPIARQALSSCHDRFVFLDPGPLLPLVRCEVDCVHGRDDDVIPYGESLALARDLGRGRAHITGLYGHTGARSGFAGPAAMARETAVMWSVLSALSRLVSRR